MPLKITKMAPCITEDVHLKPSCLVLKVKNLIGKYVNMIRKMQKFLIQELHCQIDSLNCIESVTSLSEMRNEFSWELLEHCQ